MKTSTLRLLALVTTLVILTACGTAKTRALERRVVALQSTTETYRKLVRWGYFDQAIEYLKTREGEPVKVNQEALKAWTITGYEPTEAIINDERTQAKLTAQVQYFHKDTRVASALIQQQLWWYDEKANRWYLDGNLPDFAGGAATRRRR